MEVSWLWALLGAACLAVLGLRARGKARDRHVPAPMDDERRLGYPGPMATLTDDEVKARLRRAVSDEVIHGWYTHLPIRGKKWVINPVAGPCVSYGDTEVRQFCELLDAAS